MELVPVERVGYLDLSNLVLIHKKGDRFLLSSRCSVVSLDVEFSSKLLFSKINSAANPVLLL